MPYYERMKEKRREKKWDEEAYLRGKEIKGTTLKYLGSFIIEFSFVLIGHPL